MMAFVSTVAYWSTCGVRGRGQGQGQVQEQKRVGVWSTTHNAPLPRACSPVTAAGSPTHLHPEVWEGGLQVCQVVLHAVHAHRGVGGVPHHILVHHLVVKDAVGQLRPLVGQVLDEVRVCQLHHLLHAPAHAAAAAAEQGWQAGGSGGGSMRAARRAAAGQRCSAPVLDRGGLLGVVRVEPKGHNPQGRRS